MALICISGKARHGKTTFSEYLAEALKKLTGIDFILMNYADMLKLKLAEEFNLSHDQLYGDKKEEPDHRYSKRVGGKLGLPFQNYEDGKLYEEKDLFWSAREIMQFIGTDCYRFIDNDHWVKELFKKIEKEKIENVIIADCRFENEIAAVIDRGGYHINIVRPDFIGTHNSEHISETALNFDGGTSKTVLNIDFRINNDSTLENLKATAIDTAKLIQYLISNTLNKDVNGGKDEYNS